MREMLMSYDKRHLMTESVDGSGNRTSYQYRADGKLVGTQQGAWIWAYQYDAGGRLSQMTRSMSGSSGRYTESYSHQFTGSGREENRITVNGAGTTVYRSDAYGRVIGVENALGEMSNRTLSPAGRLKREQGASGGFFAYQYDGSGRLIRAGKEGESTVQVQYNSDGSIKEERDRLGNIKKYEYDERGNLVKEITARGEKRYLYDGATRLIRQETLTRNSSTVYVTEWDYADNDRTVTVTEGGLYPTLWELNAWGETVTKTDGEGNSFTWEYDGTGKLKTARDAYGNETSYEWNEIGKVAKITNADGTEEVYTYDHIGNMKTITDNLGSVWEGSYDVGGRLIKEIGRPGIDKAYTYDSLGRVTEVKTGGDITERYEYSNRGRNITFIDGKDGQFLYEENAFGELTDERNRLGNTRSYRYDAEGQLSERREYSGNRINVSYDFNNGRTTTQYSDGTTSVITKDMRGNITEALGTTGTIRYSYDAGGKLIVQEDAEAGERTTYEYDDSGRRRLMRSGNRSVYYYYGKNGELFKVEDLSQRLAVEYVYDTMGRETARRYGNGTIQETSYDAAGRVIMIKETDAFRSLVRGEGYIYDDTGRRSGTVNEQGFVTLYEYDNQSRLKTVLSPFTEAIAASDMNEMREAGLFPMNAGSFEGVEATAERFMLNQNQATAFRSVLRLMAPARENILSAAQMGWRETYTYDANGNRLSKTTAWGKIDYAYDAENRLTMKGKIAYTYDSNGNLLTETGINRTAEYAYNGESRMTRSTVTDVKNNYQVVSEYRYDAFGRRTLTKDQTGEAMRTLYDGMSFEIIRESATFADGNFITNWSTGQVTAGNSSQARDGGRYRWISDDDTDSRYRHIEDGDSTLKPRYTGIQVTLYSRGEAVAMNRTSSAGGRGGTSYLGKDILGSVRSVSNEAGQLEDRYEYDAFGKPYQGDLDNGMNLGYMGKPYDSNTGLYNYGYRDYKPEAARFTTVDPIRDGSNWFVYVNSDPVNYLDLFGLEDVYFIYTYSDSDDDQEMKALERDSINDDIKHLEKNGLTVKIIESGTKQDITNAINDSDAIVVVTSGHGATDGIVTADNERFKPSDVDSTQVGNNLQTVIFENCEQIETEWETAFENDIDVVGWQGETYVKETNSFNGWGFFDKQDKNLRDYLNDAIEYKETQNKKGK
jgi:RHS repeat-associated protein